MFLDLISTRRSIRQFTDQPVEQEKIDILVQAALRSFASRTSNPWQFIVITDKEKLVALSKAKTHGSALLSGATLGIAVLADPALSDVWVEDAAIASTFIHLAAHDIGLGSCWVQIRKREHSAFKTSDTYVKEVLEIPDNIMIESIIAIGYPDEVKPGHPNESLQPEKVSYNRYGKKE